MASHAEELLGTTAAKGSMLWFNEARKAGVIVTEEGERLHVDGSSFPTGTDLAGRCAGLDVTFDIVENGAGRAAVNVSFPESDLPRRARRRHGRSL